MDWVKCSEKQPDKDGDYLAWTTHRSDGPCHAICRYTWVQDQYAPEGYHYWYDYFENDTVVTHWILLPEPPKGEA